MDTTVVIWVCCIVSIAACVRSAIGFGDSLIAMALLPLCIDVKIAVPLVAVSASLMGVMILWSQRKSMAMGSVWRLIVSSLMGIPLGIYVIKYLPESWVKVGLGICLLSFSMWQLLGSIRLHLDTDRGSFVAGFVAGVLGSAYNINGPPIVVYATMRKWPADTFVASLQGYFVPTGICIVLSHMLSGLWTNSVQYLALWVAPCIVTSVLLGSLIRRCIRPGAFDRFVYAFLGIAACIMIGGQV